MEIRFLNILVTILACVLIGLLAATLANADKIGKDMK